MRPDMRRTRWFVLVAGAGLLAAQPWRASVITGSSLEPFLHTGDIVFFHRGYQGLSRGSLVIFRHNGRIAIKKVHALPGEQVSELFSQINGSPVVILMDAALERRWKQVKRRHPWVSGQLIHVRVAEGRLYLVGTGPCSEDSRDYGPVDMNNILGVVTYGPKRMIRSTNRVDAATNTVPPRIGNTSLVVARLR